MDYIVSIGLEIHVVLDGETKAFSTELEDEVSWVTLGFPGTLPFLNVDAVKKTIKLASSLNCKVNYENIVFDRKNYFYYDLPRGYQITQHFFPIGIKGNCKLSSGKKITIKQIHLEEDSAQQIKKGHEIKLMFGRLGRAVAEIVTEPDMTSYEDIEEFLRKLRRNCTFLGISDASYEDGKMRVDLNVSIRKSQEDPLSVKSEVKNLNSLFSIKQSLNWLIKEQSKCFDAGNAALGYTYCWVEKTKRCEVMRKKGDAVDYFYIPEANIPAFSLSKQEYRKLSYEAKINFGKYEEQLMEAGLKASEIEYLFDNYELFDQVFKLHENISNLKTCFNWVVNVIDGLSDHPKSFDFDEVRQVVLDVEINKKLNPTTAKSILKSIIREGKTYKSILKTFKVDLISDKNLLKRSVTSAFEKYKDQLPTLSKNPQKLEKLIIGETMKQLKGRANPKLVKEFFDELMKSIKIDN